MRLQLTARHGQVDESIRNFTEQKLAKLERRLPADVLVEVTLSREHNPAIANDHAAEAIVHTKGTTLVAHESAPTFETAIDRLMDKLERQVERYRDKRTVEARRRSQHPEPSVPYELLEHEDGESAA